MGELYMSQSDSVVSDLALMLRDELTDDYAVVVDPVVYGRHADALVIGDERAFALYAKDWVGEIRARAAGDWRVRGADGSVVSVPNPGGQAAAFALGWRLFLRDEFPRLNLPLLHLLVLTDPTATLIDPGAALPHTVPLDQAVTEIASYTLGVGALLDAERRRELAEAICERRLTRRQRASEPFVIDRSGFWAPAGRHRTIVGLLRQLDRHPESGVHHLRNGSLESWLRRQGAFRYADLAAEALRRAGEQPRVAWERFVQETGLFPRPRLVVQPKRLYLGCGLSDEIIAGELRIRKGRGRGYLVGSVEPSAPWLQVEPRSFAGDVAVFVRADPRGLSLKVQPQRATLAITSNATDGPVTVPVAVRVQPRPAFVSRWLLRPVVAALLGGAVGALAGWAAGARVVPLPPAVVPAALRGLGANWGWASLLAVLGLLVGLVRGLRQHPAWPAAYGAWRWLLRAAFWAAIAVAATWALTAFSSARFPAVAEFLGRYRSAALSVAVVLGLIVGTIGQVSLERRLQKGERAPRSWLTIRRGLAAVGVVAGVLLATAAAQGVLWPALQQRGIEQRAEAVKEDATEWAGRGESALQSLVNRLLMSYYDKKAPLAPVVTTPSAPAGSAPTAAPTAAK